MSVKTSDTALNNKVDKGFATLKIELEEMRRGVDKLIEVVCKKVETDYKVDSNEVGEEKENDNFFDTTENVNDTCDVKNKEDEKEKAPNECLELSVYSPLPNIVSTIGNQSVVALEKKAVGVRYGGKRHKRSAYVCSPYVDPIRSKKQKTQNVNPIAFDLLKPVHSEVEPEYETFKKNKKAQHWARNLYESRFFQNI
ncbi:hypothetical protein ACOSQ3_023056 [Xanthoceras sorbifolium]